MPFRLLERPTARAASVNRETTRYAQLCFDNAQHWSDAADAAATRL